MAYNNDLISIFGLNTEQFILFLSLQKLLTEKDIEQSADKNIKKMWLKEWEEYFLNYIKLRTSNENNVLLDEIGIIEAIEEYKISGMDMTWYYSVILELINFRPYFSFNNDTIKDQQYSKLKFNDQYQTIREIVTKNVLMDAKILDKLTLTYIRQISKLSKSTLRQLISFSIFSVSAIAFFLNFIRFSDISLVMTILFFVNLSAYFTMNILKKQSNYFYLDSDLDNDILTIIGGGFLLGLVKKEKNVDGPFIQVSSSSNLALVQSAKLFSLIKVILIDYKGNNLVANSILKQLKEQMEILKEDIQSPNYDYEKYNVLVKHLQKSYSYMESVYKECQIIISKFENTKYN